MQESQIYQAYLQGKLDKEDIKKESQNQVLIAENSLFLKGEEELKNIRKRADNRWEWRKQINHIKYQLINKNQEELKKKVKTLLKQITIIKPSVNSKKFINIADDWYDMYKKDIKSGKLYKYYIDARFRPEPIFSQSIEKISYIQLQKFLLSIKEHRVAHYCYYIITGVFKESLKMGYIKQDVSQFVEKPKNKTEKGEWYTLSEQKLILANLDKTPIKNEILFYLLTGSRRAEHENTKFTDEDYKSLSINIIGTKTDNSKSRIIPISQRFADLLKNNYATMFKFRDNYYTKEFKQYCESIGVQYKRLHGLRHTFATNLFYLNIPDKKRTYYLGHATTSITNDIYTDFIPNIKPEDILNLYKDLYPNF